MLPDGLPHRQEPIAVSEKIIADISTGIYRTPAAALKEMVTNAYDADATTVEISTGAPDFDQLVVKDDGSGMSLERFLNIMKHIGGSWKRIQNPEGVSPLYKRPLIGRIGIGLLAVAQLGQRFYVSSSERGSESRFLAEVDLTHFHKDDAALRSMGAVRDEDGEERIEIGMIKYVDGLPEAEGSHFTVITVPDPKRGLISEMYSQLRQAIGAEAVFSLEHPAESFEDLALMVHKNKRADAVLDGYHFVLWELGLLAPVCYLKNGVFDDSNRSVVDASLVRLEEPDNFRLLVDGYDIRRPLRFPNPLAYGYGGPDPKVYILEFSKKVAGRQLAYGGYIYAQQPHIDPVELQGVQIRIRGVGIGGFDRTWLGYPFDEGIKFGQITGEIYVREGLESALNIDRASFRETDPHFLTLRAKIWEILRTEVFPEFKSRQEEYRKRKQRKQLAERQQRLARALIDAPEPVGVTPKVEVQAKSDNVARRVGWRGPVRVEAAPQGGMRQSVVNVVDGEAVIDKTLFRELDVQKADQARLLSVCAVLAAYGIWDGLTQKQAQDLLRALAVAVSV